VSTAGNRFMLRTKKSIASSVVDIESLNVKNSYLVRCRVSSSGMIFHTSRRIRGVVLKLQLSGGF
jgi:hypothetical protein